MGLTKVNVLILVLLAVNLAVSKTIFKAQSSRENVEAAVSVIKDSEKTVPASLGSSMPGRVHCEFEEATEDKVCQDHCLPKGYYYGLCVSKTCTCI